jgi:hypothetical protein
MEIERKLAIYRAKINRTERIRRQVAEYKLEQGCAECGYNTCSMALEFHHSNKDKEFTISTSLDKSEKEIWDEIAKCIVYCANHHREIHAKIFDETRVKYDYRFCPKCNENIIRSAEMCVACRNRERSVTKIDWPNPEKVLAMVKENSFVFVGRELGVSDNAVRKFLKRHGLI